MSSKDSRTVWSGGKLGEYEIKVSGQKVTYHY